MSRVYKVLTDLAHIVYGIATWYYLLHYPALGLVYLILYITYQAVDSATEGILVEIAEDILEYSVGLLIGVVLTTTYPYWKHYVPVQLPIKSPIE